MNDGNSLEVSTEAWCSSYSSSCVWSGPFLLLRMSEWVGDNEINTFLNLYLDFLVLVRLQRTRPLGGRWICGSVQAVILHRNGQASAACAAQRAESAQSQTAIVFQNTKRLFNLIPGDLQLIHSEF